jgi:Protein of unknown function (DUF3987)
MVNNHLSPHKGYPEGFDEWSQDDKNDFFAKAYKSYRAEKALKDNDLNAAWQQIRPIIAALPPVASLTPELLPKSLGDFIFDVADRQQSPADFVAVAALCGLSSLIGNKVRVYPKINDDWRIVPNLWGALIGEPSTMKTPTLKAALSPIHNLEAETRKSWQQKERDQKIDAELASLESRDSRKLIKDALKSGDRKKARQLMEETFNSEEVRLI